MFLAFRSDNRRKRPKAFCIARRQRGNTANSGIFILQKYVRR